jgi:hypothetical protein
LTKIDISDGACKFIVPSFGDLAYSEGMDRDKDKDKVGALRAK